VSNNINNFYSLEPDQSNKTTQKAADITTSYDRFEISIYMYIYFRPSGMIGGATYVQALFAQEI
jgi:hypothetical protein